MLKKSKSTKQIRAIDRIIKFQIDDGIESLTISGKEALADVSIDNKGNVTLYLNADKDKLNEIKSLVPFITMETKEGGKDPEKTKSVELSQDLTQFALEIADNSTEMANLIKSKSSIVLDLSGLVQQLLEIAGKLAELEEKNQEQDVRLTALENNLATVEQNQENQAGTLTEHDDRLRVLEAGGGSEVPAESKFIGHVKLQTELDGDNTDFVFEEIPDGSIIFLSINYEDGGVPYVFTRSFAVYGLDYLNINIGSAFLYIGYEHTTNKLTVRFENSAMGPAVVDVTYIKPEGYSIGWGYLKHQQPQ